MKYINCVYCGKSIEEDNKVVRRKGFTGNYCSWKCAALESGFFEVRKLTDELVKEDKECNGVDWEVEN